MSRQNPAPLSIAEIRFCAARIACVLGVMVAGATGGVCNLKTTRAFTTQDAKSAMEKANQVIAGFKAAGAS